MHDRQSVIAQYHNIRCRTLALVAHLSGEDMQAQSMPDASPIKWHLAHTSWFFETFVLREYQADYTLFNPVFPILFNSYYESAGKRHARPQRGLLTRPTIDEVMAYREAVDASIAAFLDRDYGPSAQERIVVGLHHEMQHQELILTDILHAFSHNPLHPAVFSRSIQSDNGESAALTMVPQTGGLHSSGSSEAGFAYDCERPEHKVYLPDYHLGSRLVTNGEWLEFMRDGAYRDPLLWLSDGWACCQNLGWEAPLYWEQKEQGAWSQFGLDGMQPVDPAAPVCHISYYEAEAFARWAGKRLPTEHELEHSVQGQAICGNFAEQEQWRPRPAAITTEGGAIQQLYGDVWEWTQSSFSPYPGFKAALGALGEYNGKFMVNQFVLRGGSCATPQAQMRASYRNFFYPHQRWQFSGMRVAADAG